MEGLAYLIGYLIAFIIWLLKSIIKLIFKIFNINIFPETKKAPPLPIRKKVIDKAEAFQKGEDFENFIRANLFRKEHFTVVERTHNYDINKDDFVESTLKPDFKFRSLKTGKEFSIEAKWRQSLFNNSLKWSYPKQFERYHSYAKDSPLYIVIGFGGSPSNPDKIFLERIDKIDDCIIPHKQLDKLNFYIQREKYKLE